MTRVLPLLLASFVLLSGCGGSDDGAAEATAESTSDTVVGDTNQTADSNETEAETAAETEPTAGSDTVEESTTVPDDSGSSTPISDEAAPKDPPAPLADDRPRTVAEVLALERPLNIAHAGGDREWPHSTPYAFASAAAAGADILEMDVQLTGDGVLVVQHDNTVDKTTETTGRVADLTFDELHALDNAHWFSPDCWPCADLAESAYTLRGVRTGAVPPPDGFEPDDFAVPTFSDIATRFPDHVLDVEMKGSWPDDRALVETLAAEIDALDRTASVVVVSFDDAMVAEFKALAPEVATSPGLRELTAWFTEDTPLGDHVAVQVPPEFSGQVVVTAESVERAHAAGMDVWVWPNHDEEERAPFYRRMVDLGAEGVIAARPSEMAVVVAESRTQS